MIVAFRVVPVVLLFVTIYVLPARAQGFQAGVTQDVSAPQVFSAAVALKSEYAWAATFRRSGRRYLRVYFDQPDNGDAHNYTVEILDGTGAIIESYGPETFAARRAFWSGLVLGSEATVLVRLRGGGSLEGLRFAISRLAYDEVAGSIRSVTPPDDRLDLYAFEQLEPELLVASQSVALLSFIVDGRLATCTGFLIGRDLLVTNEHCVNSAEICATTAIYFGYAVRRGRSSWERRETCLGLATEASKALDLAILVVSGSPGDGSARGVLLPSKFNLRQGLKLTMLQHPEGRPMQVSRIGCAITDAATFGSEPATVTDFTHLCDTLSGSSGSPLLDNDNNVAGLHHFGFTSATIWEKANRAVRVDLLQAELRRLCQGNMRLCIPGWSD